MSTPHISLAIIGAGSMGRHHASNIVKGKVTGIQLAALVDPVLKEFPEAPEVPIYKTADELYAAGGFDSVLIATPHYDHTTLGIDCLNRGYHTLVEKPISVHKADAEKLLAAAQASKGIFCAMFNQRTDPAYQKIRDLIQSNELGRIQRINWIITDWFRTEAYYQSGGWRATWEGEGGGVLLNQCPHQIDLWQWLFGMPSEVRAFCRFGEFHEIEVEDAVTAYFGYENGAQGVFITTTGEAPGTNRLEVVGEMGKLIYENGKLTFVRNRVSARDFSKAAKSGFDKPEAWTIEIPFGGHNPQHIGIMENFAATILEGKPLLAPGEEGIHSVELANAMLYSTFTDSTIKLPMDATAYETKLKELIASSTVKKDKSFVGKAANLSGTF
jgi:predicted dehydrogenase